MEEPVKKKGTTKKTKSDCSVESVCKFTAAELKEIAKNVVEVMAEKENLTKRKLLAKEYNEITLLDYFKDYIEHKQFVIETTDLIKRFDPEVFTKIDLLATEVTEKLNGLTLSKITEKMLKPVEELHGPL